MVNQSSSRAEPFGVYHFTVEIDGEHIAYPFRACSGLKDESSVVEVEEGGFNGTTRKLVGQTRFPNLVLKRGFIGASSELYRLRRQVTSDQPSGKAPEKHRRLPRRFSGVITQLGPNGRTAKWRFVSGWVCKWEGPDFDASKNEISVETVEIAHEGLEMLSAAEGR